jgi:putative transcription factor
LLGVQQINLNENMSDWDTVTVLKKRAPKASTMKSEQAVNAARRQGVPIDTQLKCRYY